MLSIAQAWGFNLMLFLREIAGNFLVAMCVAYSCLGLCRKLLFSQNYQASCDELLRCAYLAIE
jgi:hypothetical protein